MLIVREDTQNSDEISLFDTQITKQAEYAYFSDIRWHKLSLINQDIIVLIPDKTDISYHLKYLRMTSDASIVIITSNQEHLAKLHRDHVYCFDPHGSPDFFRGCLTTLMQKRQKQNHNTIDFMSTLSTGKFVLTSMSQIILISKAIAQTYTNTPQLRRGIYELLLNSFEHGIYQLGFELKQELIANKKYFAELNKRVRDPMFKNKSIEFLFHKKEDGIYININDPGLGFDFQPYLSFNKNLSDSKSGRGIAYAATYCFDQLIYKNGGNSLYAVINEAKSLQPQALTQA